VTPRIVRLPAPDRLALRALYVGTESEFAPAGGPAAPGVQPPRPPQPPAVRPPEPPQPPEEEKDEDKD